MPEAVLIINPLKDKQLSAQVFCCFVKTLGLDFGVNPADYLNEHYSKFMDAVNLVGVGEIEDLEALSDFKPRMKAITFPSLNSAKENLSTYTIFYYDSAHWRPWKWLNPVLN